MYIEFEFESLFVCIRIDSFLEMTRFTELFPDVDYEYIGVWYGFSREKKKVK